MAKDELINELISNHNQLCEYLKDLNLNPIADFEQFEVDEEDYSDDDEEDDKELFGGIDKNDTGF